MTHNIPILALVIILGAPGASAQAVFKGNEVRLCVDDNFQGECHSYFLEPGMRHRLVGTLPPSIDNKVSSIQSGVSVYAFMFRHPQFRGPSRLFSHKNLHSSPPHEDLRVAAADRIGVER